MFRQFSALLRGRTYEAAEAIADRNALPILRQQIRDCAHAVQTSRKAVAIAMAQNEQEARHIARLDREIADLEERTLDALAQDRTDLAHEAAEATAHLEAERDVSVRSQARFVESTTSLRAVLRDSEARLRQLMRGQRLASATDRTQRLRHVAPDGGRSTLSEAEGTLKRLEDRQAEMDAVARAMADLDADGSPGALSERMAKVGCGTPLKSDADAVIERLKSRAASAETAPA